MEEKQPPMFELVSDNCELEVRHIMNNRKARRAEAAILRRRKTAIHEKDPARPNRKE